MCSGGTVDNQSREACCVGNIPVAVFLIHSPTTMASSLISSSHHVDFESVFGFDDAGMVQMFETLITTGLKNFLGCPAVFYEAALTEFFTNGSVRDGLVVSTVNGVTVEISEKVFAEAFELPIDGLTDLSDVPKNLVFDARSLFSASKEQVSISCFKKEMKIEYRLLHDILAKTLFVKAGSFDAVTHERFMLMTAITFDVNVNWSNLLFGVLKAMVTPGSRQAEGFAIQIGVILQKVPGLDLGDSRPFPASRVLIEKTVHRFVNINEQGTDFWRSSCKLSLFVNRKKLSETVVEDTFVPHVFFIEPVQYWGAAPALIKTWGWHRVCTDVIRFSMFGCLRPVREDVCTDIVVYNLGVERIPASFCRSFAWGVDTDSFVRYFSDSDVESLAEIDLSSSDAPIVYRSPSPILQEADSFEHNLQFALGPAIFSGGAQEELSYFVESPESPSPIYPRQESSSSSTDVSMHFDKDDILLDDNANVQPTLSDVPTDISQFFDDLKTYLSQRMDTANSDILSRLHTVERGIQDTLGQQNDYFRGLIQSARQDAQTQDNIQTLRFNEFRKNIIAQNASIFGLADVRKEVQELNAKVDIMATNLESVKKYVETSKEAISHQLLEFQAQAQANHNILHAQLSELVAYINRGGDNKKGESSSSRGPQPPPPPVDQIRGTGVNVSTPDFAQRVEMAQRNIMERVMDTDRRESLLEAERDRERRRRELSGSKRRRRH
ncbi:hypothetical protein F511_19534 [Dorcoceras hygrometricum]|uniref:Dystroglycan-like n=1 Tax=Dorcoceras hygrometricum TaxID=472368 RepID=A0A2Z7CGP6_9LAMI|nr:hypothetical protein F511_19534 [Dorcoceras hygrometricum]